MDWVEIASVSATLFLVMDPLGNVPVFNAVLAKLAPERRVKVIVRELLLALVILLGFLFAGNSILTFLGLSQPSLNISGGVLLFIISLRMIFPGRNHSTSVDAEEPFIVPLAVPLIAGPSTIALLLLLSSTRPNEIASWAISLAAAWCATTILLVSAPLLLRIIGTRGSRALERLMGMVLVILATQMLLNGIRDFIREL
jgi:multiple antibiotic resistance protein